ncbi:MAG: membrane dipeptidase [Planctomycetes bacterium]|nr:membrane dipeptidase [Planctomycetota bacterium]
MLARLAAILPLLALATAQQKVPPCPKPPAGYEQALWAKAWQLHHACTVVDTHTDTTSRILDENFDLGPLSSTGHMDLPRMQAGGLDAAFYSIYVSARFYGDESALFAPAAKPGGDWPRPLAAGTSNGSARRALAMIDGLVCMADRYPDRMQLCRSVEELRATVAAGKHAALMGIEGGHAIEGDLALLRLFAKLGVRYMTLTHTNHNEFADSCAEALPRWGGLNTLGVKVVQEMNRLGVMVDTSHISDATFFHALRVTRAPAICSHSSMRALCGHKRNITDLMLVALKENGGVVMINYNCGFIDEDYMKASAASEATKKIKEKAAREKLAEGSQELKDALAKLDERFSVPTRPTLKVLMKHVLHALSIAGPDHVGLGSDFDGVSCVPEGLDDVTYLPRITYELLANGQSEETVRKVLGENLLRVFAAVELEAYQLRGEPPFRNDLKTDSLPAAR